MPNRNSNNETKAYALAQEVEMNVVNGHQIVDIQCNYMLLVNYGR